MPVLPVDNLVLLQVCNSAYLIQVKYNTIAFYFLTKE